MNIEAAILKKDHQIKVVCAWVKCGRFADESRQLFLGEWTEWQFENKKNEKMRSSEGG